MQSTIDTILCKICEFECFQFNGVVCSTKVGYSKIQFYQNSINIIFSEKWYNMYLRSFKY